MKEQHAGRQVAGMGLHRRRSVLARMTEDGVRLGTARIVNSAEALRAEIARGRLVEPAGCSRGRLRVVPGGGRPWRRPGRRCTWRIRWGSRRTAASGSGPTR